jgi:hypothetical protein
MSARTLLAPALVALLASGVAAQELPLPTPSSGRAPSLRRHGTEVATRDQALNGERHLAALDVTAEAYHADFGARTRTASVDGGELRQRTLALYGDGDADLAARASPPPRSAASSQVPETAGSQSGGTLASAALIALIGLGGVLARMRGVRGTRGLGRSSKATIPPAKAPRKR